MRMCETPKCTHTHTHTHTCTHTHTHTHTHMHTPLFDRELALQLPATQQKASSIHCMSCVFPRRAQAQREKGTRSLSPDMDVYSLHGPPEPPQKGPALAFWRAWHRVVGKRRGAWEREEKKKREWASWQMNRRARQPDKALCCLPRCSQCTHMKKNIQGVLHHFICSLSLH